MAYLTTAVDWEMESTYEKTVLYDLLIFRANDIDHVLYSANAMDGCRKTFCIE